MGTLVPCEICYNPLPASSVSPPFLCSKCRKRRSDEEFLAQNVPAIRRAEKALGEIFSDKESSWSKAKEKKAKQPSDFTLREPKTPDREDPERFNPWKDVFGREHGEIDWDAEFQPHAFDPYLGYGINPLGAEGEGSERPSHAGGIRLDDEEQQVVQGLIVEKITQGKKEKTGVRTGLLPGDRPIKMRRPTAQTWWIFHDEGGYLERFLKAKYPRDDEHNQEKAARALYVLKEHYLRNREDRDIAALGSSKWAASFQDEKSVKRFRQELLKQGVEMFGENKNYGGGPRERRHPRTKRFVRPTVGGQHRQY